MIRYRRLFESEGSDIKLYDVVKYAGFDWYVISLDSNVRSFSGGIIDDVVTLLAKNADFGVSPFAKDSNNYDKSYAMGYLCTTVFSKLKQNGAKPLLTKLEGVRLPKRLWLLSEDEAEKLPKSVLSFPGWWWLRSPGDEDDSTAIVRRDGFIDMNGQYVDARNGNIRPVIRVNLETLLNG
jgi:hypothetical protein